MPKSSEQNAGRLRCKNASHIQSADWLLRAISALGETVKQGRVENSSQMNADTGISMKFPRSGAPLLLRDAMPTRPTRYCLLKLCVNRVIRRVLWPCPLIYYPFGIMRRRGNVYNTRFQLYMGGYPRSGNTFSKIAFLSANPGAYVHAHQHIPTFILHFSKHALAGMVLIRNPLDAAISWAMHERQSLEEAVAYWTDFYETLIPVRADLFLVRFEDVTTDFGAVIRSFNAYWGTNYVPFEHSLENTAKCFDIAENDYRQESSEIRARRVCRPSGARNFVKEDYLKRLVQSKYLSRELARATKIYEQLLGVGSADR